MAQWSNYTTAQLIIYIKGIDKALRFIRYIIILEAEMVAYPDLVTVFYIHVQNCHIPQVCANFSKSMYHNSIYYEAKVDMLLDQNRKPQSIIENISNSTHSLNVPIHLFGLTTSDNMPPTVRRATIINHQMIRVRRMKVNHEL